MGTRSNIAILLDEKDLNRDIRFDWKKIKHPYNPRPEFAKLFTKEMKPYIYPDLYTPPAIHTPSEKGSVLMTYCQLDGYPSGVGRALLEDYNDYESALNLVIAGCLETLVWVKVNKNTYYEGFQMSPERTNPLDLLIGTSPVSGQWSKEVSLQTFPSLDKVSRQQAYLYVFKDGCWWIARRLKRGEQPVVAGETLRRLTRKNTLRYDYV